MTKRYFRATNGTFTVFRATESRVYRSAWMVIDRRTERVDEGHWRPTGEPFPVNMGFSASNGKAGDYPAEEINKAQYEVLVRAKAARCDAEKTGDRKLWSGYGSSPRDSWVRNADLDRTTP